MTRGTETRRTTARLCVTPATRDAVVAAARAAGMTVEAHLAGSVAADGALVRAITLAHAGDLAGAGAALHDALTSLGLDSAFRVRVELPPMVGPWEHGIQRWQDEDGDRWLVAHVTPINGWGV